MLRNITLIGALTLLTAAGQASASSQAAEKATPPAVQKAFTSTIVSTYPDGRIAKLWMKPGGDFTSIGRRGDRHAGHWKVKGDKVCFSRGVFGYCTQMPTDSSFTTKAVTGETIHVRLVPGREGEQAG